MGPETASRKPNRPTFTKSYSYYINTIVTYDTKQDNFLKEKKTEAVAVVIGIKIITAGKCSKESSINVERRVTEKQSVLKNRRRAMEMIRNCT